MRVKGEAGALALAGLLCLATSGCGGALDAEQSAPASGLETPQFPVERGASVLTESLLYGADAAQRSGGAVEVGTALLLDATHGAGPQYAVYRFNAGGVPLDSVKVALETATPQGVFLGLANYRTQRWEYSGPYTAQKTLAVDGGDYLSPVGNLWVSVVAPPGADCTISALAVRHEGPEPVNEPPVASVLADASSGNAPLSVLFDASASSDQDGSIVEYAWDFDGNGTYEEFSGGPLANHVFTQPGSFYVRLRVRDNGLLTAVSAVQLTLLPPLNEQPFAWLEIAPAAGTLPLVAVFDGSKSTAGEDGDSIVSYEWDFDGDGHYDSAGAAQIVSHAYLTLGNWTARLRVTDALGKQTVAASPVSTYPAPAVTALGTGTAVGSASLVVVDGNPAVCYVEYPGYTLYYCRALDPAGDTWGPPLSLATDAQWPQLAVVDGQPAVVYHQSGADLCYLRAADATGAAWGLPLSLDNAGPGDARGALAVVDGNPAVSYFHYDDRQIRYIRATDAQGGVWGAPLAVDPGREQRECTSLEVVNGNPAIACVTYVGTALQACFVRALDSTGAQWGAPQLVGVGRGNIDLAVVNGAPALVYDSYYGSIVYQRATDADGLGWVEPVGIESTLVLCHGLSLLEYNGKPVISYNRLPVLGPHLYQVCYNRGLDYNGAQWGAPLPLGTDPASTSSLALVGGQPMVAWGAVAGVRCATGFD
jgi:PKD repeat protein